MYQGESAAVRPEVPRPLDPLLVLSVKDRGNEVADALRERERERERGGEVSVRPERSHETCRENPHPGGRGTFRPENALTNKPRSHHNTTKAPSTTPSARGAERCSRPLLRSGTPPFAPPCCRLCRARSWSLPPPLSGDSLNGELGAQENGRPGAFWNSSPTVPRQLIELEAELGLSNGGERFRRAIGARRSGSKSRRLGPVDGHPCASWRVPILATKRWPRGCGGRRTRVAGRPDCEAVTLQEREGEGATPRAREKS